MGVKVVIIEACCDEPNPCICRIDDKVAFAELICIKCGKSTICSDKINLFELIDNWDNRGKENE